MCQRLTCIAVAIFSFAGVAYAQVDVVIRGGHHWGMRYVGDIMGRYRDLHPDEAKDLDWAAWNDERGIPGFQKAKCDILVYHELLKYPKGTPEETKFVPGYKAYHAGQARVAVITHPVNPVSQLTLQEIGTLLRGTGRNAQWPAYGGIGGEINCYGEAERSISRLVLRRKSISSMRSNLSLA
jgi:hypothetical protein